MRHIRPVLALTLTALVAQGCAAPGSSNRSFWFKPQATMADVRQATSKCRYEAMKHTPTGGLGLVAEFNTQTRLRDLQTLCMQADGWTLLKQSVELPEGPEPTSAAVQQVAK